MKTLGWIVGLIVLVLVGVAAYVVLNSGNIVKTAIEEFGPDYLGATVRVDEVNLALTEGTAQLKGLHIGNPQGFTGSHLMQFDEVKVVLDTSQMSETLVVMKQVLIDGADISAVAQGKKTNLQQLMDNLDAASGSGGGSADSGDDASTSEMKFIIDSFAFTNAKASLSSDLLGETELDLPDIRLADVGRKSDGATAGDIATQLFKPIVAAVGKAAVNQGLDLDGVKGSVEKSLRDKAGSGLRGLTDRFKK